MEIGFQTIHLKKLFPLAISRGIRKSSDNLFVSVSRDGITGWGEMSPGKNENAETPEIGQKILEDFFTPKISHLSISEIYQKAREQEIAPCALAALDIALWDWLSKKANMPLYRLLGFPKPKVATSVTIGINPPEVVKERIPLLLDGTGAKALKVKLGSPEGVEADKEMFAQVIQSNKKYGAKIRVDANGGWNPENAIMMMDWLAQRGVEYIEQPIEEGAEKYLPLLFKNRSLPIFVDESCRFANQIPAFANHIDGVNLKLMKCGGITGALQIIATAKAFNLKTMIGCMSESSISISAGAAISGVLDYIDLDSQLNLDPDPCTGASFINGVVIPNEHPGHGAKFKKK